MVVDAFGVLVGLPSLRLRADYLAIATIASAEIVRIVAQNARGLTGGNQGLFCTDDQSRCFDDTWLDISGTITGCLRTSAGPIPTADAAVAGRLGPVLIVTFALRFLQAPWGRVLRAVREDEDAARALGKNAFSYKLQSLAISAAVGAIAGWFLAFDLAAVTPRTSSRSSPSSPTRCWCSAVSRTIGACCSAR